MNRKGSSRKRVKCMVRKSIGEYLREKRAIFKKKKEWKSPYWKREEIIHVKRRN